MGSSITTHDCPGEHYVITIQGVNEIHIYGYPDFHKAETSANSCGLLSRVHVDKAGNVKSASWGNGDTKALLQQGIEHAKTL